MNQYHCQWSIWVFNLKFLSLFGYWNSRYCCHAEFANPAIRIDPVSIPSLSILNLDDASIRWRSRLDPSLKVIHFVESTVTAGCTGFNGDIISTRRDDTDSLLTP